MKGFFSKKTLVKTEQPKGHNNKKKTFGKLILTSKTNQSKHLQTDDRKIESVPKQLRTKQTLLTLRSCSIRKKIKINFRIFHKILSVYF